MRLSKHVCRPFHSVQDLIEAKNSQETRFLRRRYGPTDRRTDGWTDGRTDRPSYRDVRTHLKSLKNTKWSETHFSEKNFEETKKVFKMTCRTFFLLTLPSWSAFQVADNRVSTGHSVAYSVVRSQSALPPPCYTRSLHSQACSLSCGIVEIYDHVWICVHAVVLTQRKGLRLLLTLETHPWFPFTASVLVHHFPFLFLLSF